MLRFLAGPCARDQRQSEQSHRGPSDASCHTQSVKGTGAGEYWPLPSLPYSSFGQCELQSIGSSHTTRYVTIVIFVTNQHNWVLGGVIKEPLLKELAHLWLARYPSRCLGLVNAGMHVDF